MTLENTPNIVTKSGVQGLKFTDEVETANQLRQAAATARREVDRGAGARGRLPERPDGVQRLPGHLRPDLDITKGLEPAIDAVITGHTHQAYNCTITDPNGNPRLVTSGSTLGRLVTDIDLSIDRKHR